MFHFKHSVTLLSAVLLANLLPTPAVGQTAYSQYIYRVAEVLTLKNNRFANFKDETLLQHCTFAYFEIRRGIKALI